MKIEVTQCSMCTHYNTEQFCEVWKQYISNDAFYCACGVKADRKTEHRDCINCESADDCAKCRGFTDEPTISKMEQVDEPQTERSE